MKWYVGQDFVVRREALWPPHTAHGSYGSELEALYAALAQIDSERERLAALRKIVVARRQELWEGQK